MHDAGLEDRLRRVLRGEGDALQLTITTAELERRLASRRRQRLGRRGGYLAAAVATVVVGAFAAMTGPWLQAPSVGSGPSQASAPAVLPTASPAVSLPPGCDPVDPRTRETAPELIVGIVSGDDIGHGGVEVAARWNGRTTGTPGTWDLVLDDPEPTWIDAGSQRIQVISDACLIEVHVEALLTGYTEIPQPAPTSIPLEVLDGIGSRVVDIAAPPTGGWTVRVLASFPTTDGSEAWSETLFDVGTLFDAPALTGLPDFSSVIAEPGCISYKLASGASAADTCAAPIELVEDRDPVTVASGSTIAFRLTDDWMILGARTVAVDAELVARGEFAPEYSVDFQEAAGETLTVPIPLDPGSWILRITLNGSRNGDTFGAHYDIAATVTR
jgi:hypothetical protein